jgi:GDP-L-fucose synthase
LRRRLESLGFSNLVLRNRTGLDLLDPSQVRNFFETEKPEYVFLAAAKVGGIVANRDFPADFIYQNLQIQNHVIHSSYLSGVKKLLFLGSSCIYPKLAPQPLKEEYLLTGLLESSNEPYAIAKIAGIKMCQSYNRQYGTNFIACMPTNLYGPNDNFDLTSSHVLPAMIRKFHEAKKGGTPEVTLWGDGYPLREFLYVDDMADACVHMMQNFNPTKEQNESGGMFLNIGTGKDIAIRELADIVGKTVGYSGKIMPFDYHLSAYKNVGGSIPKTSQNVFQLVFLTG